MIEKIYTSIGNGLYIVQENYKWLNDEKGEYEQEATVYLEDESGCPLQDIVIIRKSKSGGIELLCYTDSEDEDYTHKFNIAIHEFDK